MMLLSVGEKIHVIHRRLFEKDIRRHFVGEVKAYEIGMVRAVGHVFVIEDTAENIFRKKPEQRTRILSLTDGGLIVNVLPESIQLDQVRYETQGKNLRVTDGSEWHLDIKEFGWS